MQQEQLADIKNLLREMQTEGVSSAEKKLAEYAQYPQFMDILISIMRDSSDQQWIKTVASSFLNNILLNYEQENTIQVSQILKKVLSDPLIKQIDKRCLQKSLTRTLNDGTQQIRNEWQFIIGEFLKSKVHFDSAYLVLACFAVAQEVPCVVLRKIIQNHFETILSLLEVSIENANLLNEMIKMWIVIVDSLRKDEENNECLFFMGNSQKLLDLIDLIYELESAQGFVVCINPIYFELNLLKYEAAELNKRLLIFEKDQQYGCRALYEYQQKNFNKFAKTLFTISQQRSLIAQLCCQDLITTLFSIQQLYMSTNFQEFSFEVAVSLIEHQIFPFIVLDDEEIEKFEESPEDFNSLTEDCCDRQTFGILKTEAIKLLETIGDKIENCHKYIFSRAIESIKVGLGFVTGQQNQSILPVETCFLILSVFSYQIGHYSQELAALKVMFCDQRLKALTPIEMSRVFTFLAYNYNEVYKTPAEGQHWIAFAFSYRVHQTARYCAFDFISNVVDDYFNQAFLEVLINQVATSQISIIWQITTKIIKNQFNILSTQGLVMIICKLFERIRTEVNMIENKQKDNRLDLNNCISQFSVILIALKENMNEGGEDSVKYKQVLASIWPITELYKLVMKWDLQDEIVKIATDIINVIPAILPPLHPLVPQFVDIFKVNGYFEKVYLRFFNQFALKANFQNDQQPLISIIIVLKDALLNSINKVSLLPQGKYSGSQPERMTLGNILIILQNILATHGNNLLSANSIQLFNQIGASCLRLLPNVDQPTETSSTGRIIMSRALNTLFLCHMHSKTECFYDYLNRLKGQNLYHGYDTLIFTLCVSREVFKETDMARLILLIESLMQIVQKSEQKDANMGKKKKGKSKIKTNAQVKKIKDMDKILTTINTAFGEQTSIGEQIINLFTKMHNGNAETVSKIFQSLTPESFATLKKYVDLDNIGKKRRVIRKVIGIKQGPAIDIEHNNEPIKQGSNSMSNKDVEEDSDEEDEAGPKRLRTKNKVDKKKNTARKINPRTYK